jgi:hypothetical protein
LAKKIQFAIIDIFVLKYNFRFPNFDYNILIGMFLTPKNTDLRRALPGKTSTVAAALGTGFYCN